MAIKFTGVPTPYMQQPIPAKQISLCQQSMVGPRAAFVEIDWSKYPSGMVVIDLLTIQSGMSLDILKSVFIDNIGLILPVTIFFPDTQFEVSCQNNATVCQDVLTGQLQCMVILGSTSISLSNLNKAVTRIWFSNVDAKALVSPQVPASVNEFQGSNLPGVPQNFIPKAAGELHAQWTLDLAANVVTDVVNGGFVTGNIFQNYNLPLATTSYLVITDIRASLTNAYVQAPNGVPPGITAFNVLFRFIAATGNQWMRWDAGIGMNMDNYGYRLLDNADAMFKQINPFNSTFDLTSTLASIGTVNNILSGKFQLDMQFSYVSLV